MKRFMPLISVLTLAILAPSAFSAVIVTTENMPYYGQWNDGDPVYTFTTLPDPSDVDFAETADFSANVGVYGGGLDKLHDGLMPPRYGWDNPGDAAYYDGDYSITIDLGSAVAVAEVNTYSWHTNVRAPQKYDLYGSTNGTDWTLIANVATGLWDGTAWYTYTPYEAHGDGVWGVSTTDDTGSLGTFRYLRFDISNATSEYPYGAFFDEFDVNVIPEPATLSFLGLGLLAVAVRRRHS